MATELLDDREQLGKFVLVPMHVAAPALEKFVDSLRHLQNFRGAIISMPHKSRMVALVDDLTPEARLAGAVNVVRREATGRLVGTSLDGEGFVEGLRSAGHRVAGARCLLMGAGGAASSIAFALAQHECASLTILNRTQPKADALADRLRQAFPGVVTTTRRSSKNSIDIAINATCLGMQANDAIPLSEEIVLNASLIAECIVAPEVTPLLASARAAGRATHSGMPMLRGQMGLMISFMGVE